MSAVMTGYGNAKLITGNEIPPEVSSLKNIYVFESINTHVAHCRATVLP
jgi:hypothetical protein